MKTKGDINTALVLHVLFSHAFIWRYYMKVVNNISNIITTRQVAHQAGAYLRCL